MLDFLFPPHDNSSGIKSVESKLDELMAYVKRMDSEQRVGAHELVKEIHDMRGQDVIGKEELLKRIEAVQEKLQYAIEDYVASDEDVKQMVRNALKSRAKTFNEIQKETKISPYSLQKYLRAMKNEVEEFNGVYRIVFSSSLVYVNGKGAKVTEGDDEHLLEFVEAEPVPGPEFAEEEP